MKRRTVKKQFWFSRDEAQDLQKKAERWHKFQADVERQFLRPEKSEMKWQ